MSRKFMDEAGRKVKNKKINLICQLLNEKVGT